MGSDMFHLGFEILLNLDFSINCPTILSVKLTKKHVGIHQMVLTQGQAQIYQCVWSNVYHIVCLQ